MKFMELMATLLVIVGLTVAANGADLTIDSQGNFLGRVEVNPLAIRIRQFAQLLGLAACLLVVTSYGCHRVSQQTRSPALKSTLPQLQLPL